MLSTAISVLLLGVFSLALLVVLCYALCQAHLAWNYRKSWRSSVQSETRGKSDDSPPATWPAVTVQLPIFNELYVVERLIDAVSRFDYPIDKLEIQVLDDSTDETVEIIRQRVALIQEANPELDIAHIHRVDRVGFKAGALDAGLKVSKGEFVAIFDADFIPPKDFLKKTVPHFKTDTAVVQTRWEHINGEQSLLTKIQCYMLDAHFGCEQQGRSAGDYYLNFNGTAGLWRKAAISDAGGWQHDTITEDIDLSYRAQMQGWKIRYFEEIGTPSEVPSTMDAVRSQQFRWTKGIAEVGRKLLWTTLKADDPLPKKIHATAHLLLSSVYLASITLSMGAVPVRYVIEQQPSLRPFVAVCGVLGLVAMACFAFFFWTSRAKREQLPFFRRLVRFSWLYPTFISYYLAIAFHNAFAAAEGFLGIKSPFIRTPKLSVKADGTLAAGASRYLSFRLPRFFYLELALLGYAMCGLAYGIYLRDPVFVLFQFQVAVSFALLCYLTVSSAWQISRMSRMRAPKSTHHESDPSVPSEMTAATSIA